MTAQQTIGVVTGIVLFVIGFVLLAVARRLDGGPRSWLLVGWVSKATETAAGLALVFAGYHVVAYLGPTGWVTFRVPVDLAWLVFAGGAAAVIGWLVTDRALGPASDDVERDEAPPESAATDDGRAS